MPLQSVSLKRLPFETLQPERVAGPLKQLLCSLVAAGPLNTTGIAHSQVRFWCVFSKPLTMSSDPGGLLAAPPGKVEVFAGALSGYLPPAVLCGPFSNQAHGAYAPCSWRRKALPFPGGTPECHLSYCKCSIASWQLCCAPAYYRAPGPESGLFPSIRRRHQQETMVKPMSSLGVSNVS